MTNLQDNIFLFLCELRAHCFRVGRHIPLVASKIHRTHYGEQKILSIPDGRQILISAIQKEAPYMAARFGTTEGHALYVYLKMKRKNTLNKKSYPSHNLNELFNNAGFFPKDEKYLYRWAELEIDACKNLDILGTMHFFGEEWIVRKLCSHATLMPASGLSSGANGWAHILEGKKVLVVHPFSATIEKQYRHNREKIFPGTNALPLFDLQCVKAVQTIADSTDDRFADWFEALDYMTDEVAKRDFDIALIGCGAYGFPLASRVKRMGKIAVHMGGSLQT